MGRDHLQRRSGRPGAFGQEHQVFDPAGTVRLRGHQALQLPAPEGDLLRRHEQMHPVVGVGHIGPRHLPVTDSEALVGIVTDRDIAFSSNVSESDLADRLRVRDVCSLDVYAVPPEEPLDAVLSEMVRRHLGSVVVTEHGKIAGVFTVTDACRYFAEYLRSHFGASQES